MYNTYRLVGNRLIIANRSLTILSLLLGNRWNYFFFIAKRIKYLKAKCLTYLLKFMEITESQVPKCDWDFFLTWRAAFVKYVFLFTKK